MSRRYAARRIRERIVSVGVETAYRLIDRVHLDRPLDAVPRPSRFSDPQSRYSMLYATQSLRCAVWESLLRGRFTRRPRRILKAEDAEARAVITLHAVEPMVLVDLRDDGPVRIGAPTAVTHDADHRAGQSLSAATYAHVPEADGFLYPSRFTGDTCVAVFDRAIDKLTVRNVTALVQHPQFADVLIEYGITLRGRAKRSD